MSVVGHSVHDNCWDRMSTPVSHYLSLKFITGFGLSNSLPVSVWRPFTISVLSFGPERLGHLT